MLAIEHISKKYKRKKVLDDISVQIEAGSIVGFVGVNGCGKSTLISIIAGSSRADSGRGICFGQDMTAHPRLFARYIGYVPQDDPLIEELSVLDNLKLWSRSPSTSYDSMLEYMGLLEENRTLVSQLSGGMKRRLSLACALIDNQPILALDEITSSLDLYQKERIHSLIRDYASRGGTIVMTTHDEGEMEMCDKLYLMRDGNVVETSARTAIDSIKMG